MSTKTVILDFASMLCFQLGDANEMDRIFDELMIELGHDDRAWFTTVAVFNGGTIADPTDTEHLEFPLSLNLVALHALFFDGRQLSLEMVQHLDAISPEWRYHTGDPLAYVVESEDDRQMRIYPRARAQKTGDTLATVEGGPAAIYTETRTSNIPTYLELPIALLVLGREFARESPHRDLAFADIATALGKHYLDAVA